MPWFRRVVVLLPFDWESPYGFEADVVRLALLTATDRSSLRGSIESEEGSRSIAGQWVL
jgi:hypothetical protein